MFNFSAFFDQASELFHSANISELMGDGQPFDLQELIGQAGLDPQELAGLAPDEVITMLQDNGIDAAQLDAIPVVDQLQNLFGR